MLSYPASDRYFMKASVAACERGASSCTRSDFVLNVLSVFGALVFIELYNVLVKTWQIRSRPLTSEDS